MSLAYIYCKYQHILFISFFVVVFVRCYFMHEKVLVFYSVLGWLFLFLLLSPVFVLIAFLHANYRMSWK